MKTRYIIGGLVAITLVIVGVLALDKTGVQYTDIQTAEQLNKKVQIKGHWIKENETVYDSHANTFAFSMRDDKNSIIKVLYNGARPNNFDIAESIVVKGKIENGVFHASDVLTKCPSKYEGSEEHIKTMKGA